MFTLVINGSRSRKQVPYRGHSSLSPENGSRQNEMCEDVFEVSLFCFAALLEVFTDIVVCADWDILVLSLCLMGNDFMVRVFDRAFSEAIPRYFV